MNLLEVKTLDLNVIKTELEIKVKKAPAFFQNCPVVLGFEMLPEEQHAAFDLKGLIEICQQLQMLPAAIRGGDDSLQKQALTNHLACIAKGREKHVGAITEKPTAPSSEDAKPDNTAASAAPVTNKTKIVTAPIRSGQQVYAAGGDLIVMAAVSAGAEVLADGNIHIYGALRGRALAGVKGDQNARIFCSSQEAELVSIAGHFLVDEQLKSNNWQQAVQINIADDTVCIRPLN